MESRILLDLKGKENKIYEEISKVLDNYKNTSHLSNEFIVEGTLEKPLISIKYPGRKQLKLNPKRSNASQYGNLFDFVVVVHIKGKENISDFTFVKILDDFYKHKKYNKKFWKAIKEVYYNNKIPSKIPQLKGIDSLVFLSAIKWIWIQEDFNYKMGWEEVKSPTRYKLISKRGGNMSKGAGRAKSFGAMVLLNSSFFNFEEVKKIIAIFG